MLASITEHRFEKALAELPLHSRTPLDWARTVLQEPVALLIDHAFLERKAANNAMEMLTRWPNEASPELRKLWIDTMTAVARDETAHLAQVTRLLAKRGGELDRIHKNAYAGELRKLVRKGTAGELVDRLFVAALIEARSCERFGVLAAAAFEDDRDPELGAFFQALFSSELGHYKVFLKLADGLAVLDGPLMTRPAAIRDRWQEVLAAEAEILARQAPGARIHSGFDDDA